MNIKGYGFGSSVFGGGFLTMGRGLKSTQQKMERQEARDRQVAFYENQKENLKNVKCETVEEIVRKLELFHSYEDQIAAAKMAYNNEQMWHMMDESREIGEKIAEAVEKSKPKTPEERQEDLVEEITGTESGGMLEELDEMMEEALELQEELQDAQQETMPDAKQDIQQEMTADALQKAEGEPSGIAETTAIQGSVETEEMSVEEIRKAASLHCPFDIKI